MIKTCPTCKRTYADEAISFCLADGSLLSAPYDAQSHPAVNSEKTGPPTEVLPASLAPTQAAQQPTPIPTITAAPPHESLQTFADAEPAQRSKRALIVTALSALLLLAALAGAYWFFIRRGQPNLATNPANVNISDPAIAGPSETPKGVQPPFASPSVGKASAVASPALNKPTPSPPNSKVVSTPASPLPTAAQPAPPLPTPAQIASPERPSVDYNKVFSGREVDQKAKLLSNPRPDYTEEARKNGVSGTVTLSMVLTAAGGVTNIKVIKGLPDGLSEKAIAAAQRIKFEPAKKDGRSVSQYVQLQFTFSLY